MANEDITMYDLMKAIQGVDAKVDGVSNRLDQFQKETYERFEQIDKRFDNMQKEMDERFDNMQKEMNDRFDKVDGKIDNLNDRMTFVEQKTQDNERDIFLLKQRSQ